MSALWTARGPRTAISALIQTDDWKHPLKALPVGFSSQVESNKEKVITWIPLPLCSVFFPLLLFLNLTLCTFFVCYCVGKCFHGNNITYGHLVMQPQCIPNGDANMKGFLVTMVIRGQEETGNKQLLGESKILKLGTNESVSVPTQWQ